MATTGEYAAGLATSEIGQIPYKLGATVGDTANKIAADCSSFIQSIFSKAGIDLPRTADQQYLATKSGGGLTNAAGEPYATGTSISTSDLSKLQAGDLLFFGGWNDSSNPPGYGGVQHVGVYAANGVFIEEGGDTQNVNAAVISSPDWLSHLIGITRPTANSATASPRSTGITAGTPTSSGSGILGTGFDPVGFVQGIFGQVSKAADIPGAIAGIGNTFSDVMTFLGIVGLALVLIIGGIILIRPQTISDAATVAGAAK